ncbi:MAG: hypothetical protein KH369_16135 [Paraclostridium bifermentans]|uniref:hypothetical protein n=1 Tax=Paraclostridium bifermentans TaxID=1490 RepID=UPI001DBA23E5|nr:hypothetical protein [Paraclostridium bifermentans]MBS6509732.1 hypothetical protein [Paraclostridium bifermentans]MDU3803978.1 hypothetical protein [Paraclostridium bifermentans]
MGKLKLLAIIAILTISLAGCTNSKEETKKEVSKIDKTQEVQKDERRKTIETPVGVGELIPLKSGSGNILEGQNYLKVISKGKPSDSDIIKTYNELSKSDLEFNYFIIQYGDQGIHFVKNAPIGNVGEVDFDCAPLQSGSQLKETKKFLTIDGDKIIEKDATKEIN